MPKKILFVFGGAIGDALLGVHLAHALHRAGSRSQVVMLSTRKSGFVRQLTALLPEVSYIEMPRNEWRSWVALVRLAFSPHAVIYLEPFQDQVALWWRIIARVATLMPGSREVHYQAHAKPVPSRIETVVYDMKHDNLFSVMTRVLPLWGMEAPALEPFLPSPQCEAPKKSFILFHFFAGSYRRSWPVEKARTLFEVARQQFPEHEFVVTCAHPEEAAARQMVEGIERARVEVSPPPAQLFCLLKQSSVCVGVASGVTLIAAHLRVPAVILCNLSDPCWLPTWSTTSTLLAARAHCGCNGDKTGECAAKTAEGTVYRCLYDITTQEVIGAMEQKIHR